MDLLVNMGLWICLSPLFGLDANRKNEAGVPEEPFSVVSTYTRGIFCKDLISSHNLRILGPRARLRQTPHALQVT